MSFKTDVHEFSIHAFGTVIRVYVSDYYHRCVLLT